MQYVLLIYCIGFMYAWPIPGKKKFYLIMSAKHKNCDASNLDMPKRKPTVFLLSKRMKVEIVW